MMYVYWREREHEDIDILVDEDPTTMAALRQCGLWKFFWSPFMRAQPRLLNALVDYWHPDAEAFMLEGQLLTPTTEDIYFLTGLSRRGELVNLRAFPPGPHNIAELIELHCEAGTEKVGSQVPINKITNLSLKVIVLLIGWITGSVALHQASRAHMRCAVQCLNAQIFDWSTTMLDCMKRQLTECREWNNKNFGFGTILCSFFFERVPGLSSRETVRGHVASVPTVCRWEALLPRQGGGRTIEVFDDTFFDWWARQISAIADYPYVEINFSRDPDMPLPPGAERGEMGMF